MIWPFGYFQKKSDQRLKKLIVEELESIKKQNKKILEVNHDLTTIILQIVEDEEFDDFKNESRKKRNNDLRVINSNFSNVNKKIKEVKYQFKHQFESLLETFAEKIVEQEQTGTEPFNIFSRETNLRKIFERKDKNQAALMGILYLIKKLVEEKGLKV